MLLPVIQGCSRGLSSRGGLVKTLILLTANCIHQPPWMHLNPCTVDYSWMMDAHGCLEVIFALFFFKSIAWKEGDGIGTSASPFLLFTWYFKTKNNLQVYDGWISEKRTSAESVVELLLLAGFSSFPLQHPHKYIFLLKPDLTWPYTACFASRDGILTTRIFEKLFKDLT